ncbi:MAG: DUF1738 domain-containing protein [Chitinophagaceae bacterium]|nr:DUF1738 domain-containing protein [Chitinophagaceae bacterium]
MDSQNTTSTKLDVYQIVTDRMITLLEQGTAPWQKPWTDSGIPMNLLSKRAYRGVNLWLLLSLDYERNLFLTWDQIKKLGASVKQGEHGHVVVFWRTLPKKKEGDDGEEKKQIPMLRYYKVFNVAQIRDLPANMVEPIVAGEQDTFLQCEPIYNMMPQCPDLRHKGQSAYYDPKEDYVNMPGKKTFKKAEGYYATLFHELVHSTGHEKRLNRPTLTEMAEFGSDMYSIEELVAELGAAYLSASTGILERVEKNSAAYLNGWIAKLKNDKRFIIQASGQAQRAVDFILNRQFPADDPKEVEQSELLGE